MTPVSPRVLVVEDSVPLVRLLTVLLEYGGFAVSAVTTVAAALACLNRDSFDLVLMDSFSPTPHGVYASTSVIQQAAGSMPVILLTGYRVDLTTARVAGCAGVLQKPFDIDDLLTCLHNVLRPVPLS